jgi:hypothetical protein
MGLLSRLHFSGGTRPRWAPFRRGPGSMTFSMCVCGHMLGPAPSLAQRGALAAGVVRSRLAGRRARWPIAEVGEARPPVPRE